MVRRQGFRNKCRHQKSVAASNMSKTVIVILWGISIALLAFCMVCVEDVCVVDALGAELIAYGVVFVVGKCNELHAGCVPLMMALLFPPVLPLPEP